MGRSSWSVLIDQIEKVDKKRRVVYGDFVLINADERSTFLRKVLFLLDMISPMLFVLKHPIKIRVSENKLLVPTEVMEKYKRKINEYASNYVWLVSFLEKTLKILKEVESRNFVLTLGERINLEGRLFLIQLHLINKLLQIYRNRLCKELPLPKPLKPSYNTYLTSLIAQSGLENTAKKHPFVKMLTVWKSMEQLEAVVKEKPYYMKLYSKVNEHLEKQYKDAVSAIMNKIARDTKSAYKYGACLMLYSLLSHLMWIAEWENYYTFKTRENALKELEKTVGNFPRKNLEEVINYVIERIVGTL